MSLSPDRRTVGERVGVTGVTSRDKGGSRLRRYLHTVKPGSPQEAALRHAYLKIAIEYRLQNGRKPGETELLQRRLAELDEVTGKRAIEDRPYALSFSVITSIFTHLEAGGNNGIDFKPQGFVLRTLRSAAAEQGLEFDEIAVYRKFRAPHRRGRSI